MSRIMAALVCTGLSAAGWLGAMEKPEEPPEIPKPMEFPAPKPAKPDPQLVRLATALATELDKVEDKELSLNDWLQVFAKASQANFLLDPGLPRSVGETKMTVRVQKGTTVLDALGVALTLTGLRYAIVDGNIFISTEERLTERIMPGKRASEPLGYATARRPLTVEEVMDRAREEEPFKGEYLDWHDFMGAPVGRVWEPPRYNPRTGLVDYPGPPAPIEIDLSYLANPQHRYTSTPFFLRPEYLYLEQLKREARDEEERKERRERQASAQALSALLQFLKDHPDMKVEEVLKKLGQEKK